MTRNILVEYQRNSPGAKDHLFLNNYHQGSYTLLDEMQMILSNCGDNWLDFCLRKRKAVTATRKRIKNFDWNSNRAYSSRNFDEKHCDQILKK